MFRWCARRFGEGLSSTEMDKIIARMTVVHWLMVSTAVVSLVAFMSDKVKRALLLIPHRTKRGQWHRLLTAGWIHADMGHLITNMFVLFLFADRVVAAYGEMLFLALYVSAVVVAYVPTTLRYRNNPKYSSLGASGAVAAVMLAAVLLDPMRRVGMLFFPIRIPGVVFGVLYILYSVWHSAGSDDNINHDAHFSGAVYGIIATAVWAPDKLQKSIRVLRQFAGI